MKEVLFLDSNKATNNKFNLDNRIEGQYKLLSFASTNNIFNVNEFNNKVYLNIGGFPFTATIPDGYYGMNDLKTKLTTVLNALGGGTFTITFDDNTRKFTITNTTTYYFTFGTNTSNSARKLLGYDAVDGSTSLTQTSSNPIDLNTCKNIFISITEDDQKDIIGIDFFSPSLVITGIADFGDTLRYIERDNFCQYLKFRQTKTLEVKFHDSSNNSINLNSDYHIILQKL